MSFFLQLPEFVQMFVMNNLSACELARLACTDSRFSSLTEIVAARAVKSLLELQFSKNLLEEKSDLSHKEILRELTKNRILCFGGGFSEYSLVELSLPSGTWSERNEIPMPRENFEAISAGGLVYVFSGEDAQSLGNVQKYNTMSDKWSACAPLPRRIQQSSCVSIGKDVLVVGGEDVDSATLLSSILVAPEDSLSNESSSWRQHNASLITPRKAHSCAVYDNKLWVAGGLLRGFEVTNSVEVMQIQSPRSPRRNSIDSRPASGFRQSPDMCKKRRNFKLLVVEEQLYAIGGDEEASIEVLGGDGSWSVATNFPTFRRNFTASSCGSKIYIFGGQDCRRKSISSMDIYDVATDTWASEGAEQEQEQQVRSRPRAFTDDEIKSNFRTRQRANSALEEAQVEVAAAEKQWSETDLRLPATYGNGLVFGHAITLEYSNLTWA